MTSRKPKLSIIDHQAGNLLNLERALRHLGADVSIAASPHEIGSSAGLVLPGVGSFGDSMRALSYSGLKKSILNRVLAGQPLLGICLGMQLLFTESEEFGLHEGFNLVPGRVIRLRETSPEGRRIAVPHIGWSAIHQTEKNPWSSSILAGLETGEFFYFLHSYTPAPAQGVSSLAEFEWGGYRYLASFETQNLYGLQFHPERSGEPGLMILKNFLDRCRN